MKYMPLNHWEVPLGLSLRFKLFGEVELTLKPDYTEEKLH